MEDEEDMFRMYGVPDEEDAPETDETLLDVTAPKPLTQQELTALFSAHSVTLTVDGKQVVIPTLAYVQKVEEIINAQGREIRRLLSRSKQHHTAINAHTSDINDVYRELDRKVNRNF